MACISVSQKGRTTFAYAHGHQESGRVDSLPSQPKRLLEEISSVPSRLPLCLSQTLHPQATLPWSTPRFPPVSRLLLSIAFLRLGPGQRNILRRLQRVYQKYFNGLAFTSDSAASDPAQNPYWKRDVRRAYPQLSVVTQSELSSLLIEHSTAQSYVATTSILAC
jgi:hypothetical protein